MLSPATAGWDSISMVGSFSQFNRDFLCKVGQLSVVYRAEGGRVAELLRVRLNARLGTPEWKKADEQLKQLDEKM
jgi:hypothetical protein